MGRLERIRELTDEKKAQQKLVDDKDLDDFSRLRRDIARELRAVRTMIEARNKDNDGVSKAERSAQIRNRLKAVKKDGQQLSTMQQVQEKKVMKKKKPKEELVEEVKLREETVELVFKHIKECEALEKHEYAGDEAFLDLERDGTSPLVTELPQIDSEEGKIIAQNEVIINDLMDDISRDVSLLKDQAGAMNREAKKQVELIAHLEEKADDLNQAFDNINTRMKDYLKSIRSANKFITDIILICVILGIAGIIYSIAS